MFRPTIQIRLGLMVVLAVFGGAPLFALADEITHVTVSNTSIQVDMMGTKPVYTTDSFTNGGEDYFLLSFSHSVLLGSPRQRFVLPNRSATVTTAQYSDHPYIVHLLVHDNRGANFRVAAVREPGAHYRISVTIGKPGGPSG